MQHEFAIGLLQGAADGKTFAWFGAYGIMLSRSGSEREYAAEVHGIDGLDWFYYPGEIPVKAASGASIWV